MQSLFDGPSKAIENVNGEDILLKGSLPPDNDIAVCLVPPSVIHDQGIVLEKVLESKLRQPVLVLTNNVQLVRLKPISDAAAKKVMSEHDHSQVIQFARQEDPADSEEKSN